MQALEAWKDILEEETKVMISHVLARLMLRDCLTASSRYCIIIPVAN